MQPLIKKVVIHCKPAVLNTNPIKNGYLYWDYSKQFGTDEIDVVVKDIPYDFENDYYQDPDEQLCEHYGIDYTFVNCIEMA